MHGNEESNLGHAVRTFERNRYFFGKLLDVVHFELEQDYLNGKRWLLNRLVNGYGVVCGLDVVLDPEGTQAVVVCSGVALDRAGREIVVPRKSAPVPIPAAVSTKEQGGECEKEHMHLCLCFKQCEADPVPVAVDDCGQATSSSASSIQERYSLELRHGRAPEIELESSVAEFALHGRFNYRSLVDRISRHCPPVPADTCIPLANICLPQGEDALQPGDIDIAVRPIVYTLDLLFDIILSLAGDNNARPRGGKQ